MFFKWIASKFNKNKQSGQVVQQRELPPIDTDRVTLTQQAIDWVVDTCTSICSTDFIGYLFELNRVSKKFKGVGGALDVFGGFMLFSLDEKDPHMDNDKVVNIYNYLIDIGFLVVQESCPFEEFDQILCGDVPIDYQTTQFVEDPVFYSVARKRRYSGYGNGIEYTCPIFIE